MSSTARAASSACDISAGAMAAVDPTASADGKRDSSADSEDAKWNDDGAGTDDHGSNWHDTCSVAHHHHRPALRRRGLRAHQQASIGRLHPRPTLPLMRLLSPLPSVPVCLVTVVRWEEK